VHDVPDLRAVLGNGRLYDTNDFAIRLDDVKRQTRGSREEAHQVALSISDINKNTGRETVEVLALLHV
jgi:hypothetical protein